MNTGDSIRELPREGRLEDANKTATAATLVEKAQNLCCSEEAVINYATAEEIYEILNKALELIPESPVDFSTDDIHQVMRWGDFYRQQHGFQSDSDYRAYNILLDTLGARVESTRETTEESGATAKRLLPDVVLKDQQLPASPPLTTPTEEETSNFKDHMDVWLKKVGEKWDVPERSRTWKWVHTNEHSLDLFPGPALLDVLNNGLNEDEPHLRYQAIPQTLDRLLNHAGWTASCRRDHEGEIIHILFRKLFPTITTKEGEASSEPCPKCGLVISGTHNGRCPACVLDAEEKSRLPNKAPAQEAGHPATQEQKARWSCDRGHFAVSCDLPTEDGTPFCPECGRAMEQKDVGGTFRTHFGFAKDNIDAALCAKLVRKVLKREAPNVKFSVRTKKYSMGSSISVYWTDGPTSKQVEKLVGHIHGATFDGMQDLKEYLDNPFGNDYIFTERSYSDEKELAAARQLWKEAGQDPKEVTKESLSRLVDVGSLYRNEQYLDRATRIFLNETDLRPKDSCFVSMPFDSNFVVGAVALKMGLHPVGVKQFGTFAFEHDAQEEADLQNRRIGMSPEEVQALLSMAQAPKEA